MEPSKRHNSRRALEADRSSSENKSHELEMSGSIGTLGKYQIIREIARSNDIVYEAYDPLMNRRVALKELAMPSGSTSQQQEDRRSRFLREARAAGTLTHPNIVTVYEYGVESGRQYIAMEFLEGHTLRNEIDTRGFLSHEKGVEIAIEVLEALEYAHKNGVIHRDIKPDNIQLLPDGRVKLTDFGIARLTFEPNITMDGQVFGTPSYMSPEQVVGKEIDARSDLFGVGVVLYEMLTGKKPFGGDSVVSITYAIMNTTPEVPAQVNWAVWQIIERALEKSPALRFDSASEMRVALESAQTASSGVVFDPPVPQAANYQQVTPPPINNPYLQSGNPYLTGQPYIPQYPQAPPATYGHDPFGQPTGQYPSMPTGPIPVYYPPPPRRALIKPETRTFMRKLFVTVLVLGTFFALVIVIVNGLSTALARAERQGKDQIVLEKLEEAKKLSPQKAIAAWELTMRQLQDPINRAAANQQLAVLYERRGKELLSASDLQSAAECFLESARLDPANAAYPSDLGDLYARRARTESLPTERISLWQESCRFWDEAARLETSIERSEIYRAGAAEAHKELGKELLQLGDRTRAREAFGRALEYCGPGDSRVAELRALIDRTL